MLSTMVKAPRLPLATITTAYMAGGRLRIPTMRPRRERLNGFRAMIRSKAHGWEAGVPIDIVQTPAYVAADGGEKTGSGDFALVQDPDQAAALAAYGVLDSRELGPIVLPLKPRCMGYRIGDCLTLDLPEHGLVTQPAVIRGYTIDPGTAVVTLTFMTETLGQACRRVGPDQRLAPRAVVVCTIEQYPRADGRQLVGDRRTAGRRGRLGHSRVDRGRGGR